jgi:hypothetical protein
MSRWSNSISVFRDAASWEWDLISAVLRAPGDAFLALDTPAYRAFAARLVDFFKPSNNAFSKVELTNKRARFLARSGCYLLDCFVKGTTVRSRVIDNGGQRFLASFSGRFCESLR